MPNLSHSSEIAPRSRRLALLWLVPLLAFFLAIHLIQVHRTDSNPLHWHENSRLMTTADAYYHLRLTQDYLADTYTAVDPLRDGPRPSPLPPLVWMTATAHQLTGAAVEHIAFFLPLLLAALSIPLVWLWARSLMPGSLGPILAVLAASTSFGWYRRVLPGKFDTDSLNLVLVWGLVYFVYRLATDTERKSRLTWLACAIVCSLMLWVWWPHAGLPAIGIGVGLYALSLPLSSPAWEKALKGALLAGGAILLLLSVFNPPAWLPSMLTTFLNSISDHLALIFRVTDATGLAMGDTVDELLVPGWLEAGNSVVGNVVVLLPALAGLVLLAVHRPRAAFFVLAPTLLFILSAFGGRRFLMFLAPAYGLGMGYLLTVMLRQVRPWLGKAAITIAFLAALHPGLSRCLAHANTPSMDLNSVKLVSELDTIASPEAKIWNWWGPGYFTQYYSKRKTFIDGGLQSPLRSYIAAVPLASPDIHMARRWIKFFTRHPNGLHELASYAGSTGKAVEAFKSIFADPAKLNEYMETYRLPATRDWEAYFFPKNVEVYLVLFSDMLIRSSWLDIGRRDFQSTDIVDSSIYGVNHSESMIDYVNGTVTVEGKTYPFGVMFSISPNKLSYGPISSNTNVAVEIKKADKLFYMSANSFNCLAFRLLFLYPTQLQGFEKIAYNPFVGGVWRIK